MIVRTIVLFQGSAPARDALEHAPTAKQDRGEVIVVIDAAIVIKHVEGEGEIVPPKIDFDDFHQRLIASDNGEIDGLKCDGLVPISFHLPDGRSYSYVPSNGSIRVIPGTTADIECVVQLPEDTYADYAVELLTASGIQVLERATYPIGTYNEFDAWEPYVRLLYAGRPLYDPGAVYRDELDRTFSTGDSDEDIRGFLDRNGFAVVRDVFHKDELEEIGDALDELVPSARPDVKDSWWTTDRHGTPVPCQMLFLGLHSDYFSSLDRDSRFLRFANIFGHGVRPRAGGQGFQLVAKHTGASEGIVNLPWHNDCGLGGHPILCPTLVMGIQLTESNAEVGGLSMLAGSHQSSVPRIDPINTDWPQVLVEAEPGDITLHSSHVLHAAPPPTGVVKARRTLYDLMSSPSCYTYFGFHRSFNDIMYGDNTSVDGHVHMDADAGSRGA